MNNIDLHSAWEDQYNAFLNMEVDCDNLEDLIWNTYRFVIENAAKEEKNISDYDFVVPMVKILGLNDYSNIGQLRTDVYCKFIEALSDLIFSRFPRKELEVEIYHGERETYSPESLDDLKLALKDVASALFNPEEPENYCPYVESDCEKDSCDGCERYWET